MIDFCCWVILLGKCLPSVGCISECVEFPYNRNQRQSRAQIVSLPKTLTAVRAKMNHTYLLKLGNITQTDVTQALHIVTGKAANNNKDA